ncbi:transcription factor-related [Striga hermonthica]|uniref:Transcription factor-related n=1 Tax=Striga hermonthica TaxID=68872 RepID=A0A9N7RQ99_STRHE|nr:transcription factor-related [Striga hermonthica]
MEHNFSDFHKEWMAELEKLVESDRDESIPKSRLDKLTAHHKAYYTRKWAAAEEDIAAFYAAEWLNPFEKARMWVTGWKPSSALQLAESMKLSDEQRHKMARVRAEIKTEEEKVESEMRSLHNVATADPEMLELMRMGMEADRSGSPTAMAEVDKMVDEALKMLKGRLLKLMKMADCARLKALKGVLDVVGPVHGLTYFTSVSIFLIGLRNLGEPR